MGLDPLELWLLGGLAVMMLAAVGRIVWMKLVGRSKASDVDPFLVFPDTPVRYPVAPEPGGFAWGPASSEQPDGAPSDPATSDEPPSGDDVPEPPQLTVAPEQRSARTRPAFRETPQITPSPLPSSAPPPPAPPGFSRRPRASPAALFRDEVDEGSQTIRLPTAADGTVQLLPGKLVVTQGPDVGREFRFLRIGNQPVPELTIGRAGGPPYRHIQLPAVTVSRLHARIRFHDQYWHIANLSTTNPLRLNGHELRPMEESILNDGDRIQLGEVELRYGDQRL